MWFTDLQVRTTLSIVTDGRAGCYTASKMTRLYRMECSCWFINVLISLVYHCLQPYLDMWSPLSVVLYCWFCIMGHSVWCFHVFTCFPSVLSMYRVVPFNSRPQEITNSIHQHKVRLHMLSPILHMITFHSTVTTVTQPKLYSLMYAPLQLLTSQLFVQRGHACF